MKSSFQLIYKGNHSGEDITILKYDHTENEVILKDIPEPKHWFKNERYTYWVYEGKFDIPPSLLYYENLSNVFNLSDVLKLGVTNILSDTIVIVDIENGGYEEINFLENWELKPKLPIFIGKKGFNQYSLMRIKFINAIRGIQFINLPSTMRIIMEDISMDYLGYYKPRFINSNCTIQCPTRLSEVDRVENLLENLSKCTLLYQSDNFHNPFEVVVHNSPIDRIRLFNMKRGLIEQGFDLRRELNFIMEEVVEATNSKLGSDKAKEKAKIIINELLKDCNTTDENTLDSLIDIFVFAVGAMYKLAPKMNINVLNEISKVLDNIEFKPHIKDENGKVIKDENYKKYREKK